MIRTTVSRSFRFLTPAFAHGAYQSQRDNIPELRAPSLRGQLRGWWRTLGYGSGDDIFGSATGNSGTASKVQVRLEAPLESATTTAQILPHKENPGHRGPKNAISQGTDLFTIRLIPVRSGITTDQADKLTNVLDAWLLMGAIGQRANRSAGSPWPEEGAPATIEDYLVRCRTLLAKSPAKIAVLDFQSETFHDIRILSGRFSSNSPGRVFGAAIPRKSSSLKLRAVHLDGAFRITAVWCPKDPQDTPQNLLAAIGQMNNHPTKSQLGHLLENALPELT